MTVIIQPDQISTFMGAIKHMVVASGRIREISAQTSMNRMLYQILSGLYQCWIVFDDIDGEREMHAIALTCVAVDDITSERTLCIDAIYAWRPLTPDLADDAFNTVVSFAKENKCVALKADTSVPRAIDILLGHGFKETMRSYRLEVD